MSLIYLNKVPASFRDSFEQGIRSICTELNVKNPDWLMIVIWAESQFKTDAKNPKSTATGLIQFIESTAKSIGTTTAELRQMNHVQQLKYVRLYLISQIKAKGVPSDGYQLYLLVHYPVAVNRPDSTVVYRSPSDAYNGNNGLDYNKDGTVTIAEIKTFLNSKVPFPYTKSVLVSVSETEKTSNLLLNMFLLFFFGTTAYYILFKGGFTNLKLLTKAIFNRS